MVVALALTAALCFASASVLQQKAAVAAPASRSLRVGLLLHLARRPLWLVGILADAAGYLLQVLALDRGPLALVQPLLASGLLFALLFNVSPGKRGLRAQDWAAALVMAGGLALFVLAGAPRGDSTAQSPEAWVAFGALGVAAATGCLLLGRRETGAARAALLAAAAGIAFGLSAGLTKQCVNEWHHGLRNLMLTGYPYGLMLSAAGGMLMAQSAFQAGALAASLPTLTLCEPLFATAAGVLLFREHIRPGWPGALGLLAAAAAAVAATMLARSPRAQPIVAA